jgi:hypothetical protein
LIGIKPPSAQIGGEGQGHGKLVMLGEIRDLSPRAAPMLL